MSVKLQEMGRGINVIPGMKRSSWCLKRWEVGGTFFSFLCEINLNQPALQMPPPTEEVRREKLSVKIVMKVTCVTSGGSKLMEMVEPKHSV